MYLLPAIVLNQRKSTAKNETVTVACAGSHH